MHENLRRFLETLLDSIDAGRRNRRRLTPQDVPVAAEKQIDAELEDLRRAGLIERILSKADRREDAPGVVEILDSDGLATLLRYKRHPQRLQEALAIIDADVPAGGRSMLGKQAFEMIHEAWSDRRSAFGIPVSEASRAALLLKFLDAIARGEQQGKDVRQFSTALGLGSKDFESVSGPLFKLLRELFALADDEDVLEAIGLVRYGQPILLGGPVLFDGVPLPADPFIGIAPEKADRIAAGADARYLLTIENLASFHRYVRAIQDGGLVVFTGGFPRPAVLAAILRLAGNEHLPVYHWGDIDAGGVTIFRTIELSLGGRLQPHLMTPALAEHDGHPIKTDRRLVTISETDSAIAPLASWLMRCDARKLEQEALTPISPLSQGSLDAENQFLQWR